MQFRGRFLGRTAALAAFLMVLAGVSGAVLSGASAKSAPKPPAYLKPAVGSVRGFNGKVIKVAAMGLSAYFPTVAIGAQGRIDHFNKAHQIPGIKIKFVANDEDGGNPATSLSDAQQLVTSDKIFAIVGDTSISNPATYLDEQHVPTFGIQISPLYCSPTNKPDLNLWLFTPEGCADPANPKVVPDYYGGLFKYLQQKTDETHPTVALFTNPSTSASTLNGEKIWFTGPGFRVVYAQNTLPMTVTDYTPYIQAYLTSNGGSAPSTIVCVAAASQCITVGTDLRQAGFKGVYSAPAYGGANIPYMKGDIAPLNTDLLSGSTSGVKAYRAAMESYDPSLNSTTVVDTWMADGYSGADMFIKAVKTLAAYGKRYITPENVQRVVARMTWEIKGFMGPLRFPASSVVFSPVCQGFALDTGTKWETLVPYRCTTKTFKVTS